MIDIHAVGAFGIMPFMNEEVNKKFREIKTRAGRIAYLASLGKKRANKPHIKEGVYEARGALKWISKVLDEEEKKKNEK